MDIEKIASEVEKVISKKSASTKRNYVSSLNHFINEYQKEENLTFEQLFNEASEDVTKTQARIDGYYNWLVNERGLKETSAFINAYGYIRGFFTNQDISFKHSWDIPKPSKTKEAIKKDNAVTFFEVDTKKRAIRFNREKMQKFLNNLKLRDKAIALALLSTGQDSGDLFKLNVGDIRHQEGERIFLDDYRGKTKIHFRTFLSKEATRLVRQYLELERSQAEDNEPLFTYSSRKHGQEHISEERMTPNYLASVFRDAARGMHIKWENGEHNPLRPKRMRHLFRTACDTAGVNELYVNAFRGHRNHQGQDYSELSKAKLELEYLRVEPFLTVFGEAEEALEIKEDVRKLEKRIVDLNREIAEQKRTIENQKGLIQRISDEFYQKTLEIERKFNQRLKDFFADYKQPVAVLPEEESKKLWIDERESSSRKDDPQDKEKQKKD